MGSTTVLLALFAAVVMISYAESASSTCPLPSKVYGCSPKCQQNYECSNGKVCCSNACNTKSCTEPAAYGAGSGGNKYSQSSGAGVYCDNVKCNSFEVCKLDPTTKRNKCSRA